MAHITETHSNMLDGLRSTYDGDWPLGALSGVVIGQEVMSITAEGNEALNPSVRWRKRDKEREIGAESKVSFVCERSPRHTACWNEAKPVRGPALRFHTFLPAL